MKLQSISLCLMNVTGPEATPLLNGRCLNHFPNKVGRWCKEIGEDQHLGPLWSLMTPRGGENVCVCVVHRTEMSQKRCDHYWKYSTGKHWCAPTPNRNDSTSRYTGPPFKAAPFTSQPNENVHYELRTMCCCWNQVSVMPQHDTDLISNANGLNRSNLIVGFGSKQQENEDCG